MKRILQDYKIKTKAARVDRATSPLLLNELRNTVKSEYIVARFQEPGIHLSIQKQFQ
jgi:hypothetical protein